MVPHRVPCAEAHRFGRIVLDLLDDAEGIRPFREHPHARQGLLNAAAARRFDAERRAVLCGALRQQHRAADVHHAVRTNLAALERPDALAVTTGHQLALFGGPLYVAFKALNAVRTAHDLQAATGRPVVPVFWMASEDHDRAEIAHATLGGHRVEWPGEATGPVGRMPLTGIGTAVERACSVLPGTPQGGRIAALLREAYRPEHTLAQATRILLNALFGRFGLIVVDGDDPALKRLFAPLMREELLHQVSHRAVGHANTLLAGRYGVQAHVRPINLFHLRPGHRARIVLEDGRYHVLDGGPSFAPNELLGVLERTPEAFSPNVLLRPLYQEHVLPGVATIGGGGEVAYWLQLKWLFQALHVPMPVVLLRTSAAFLPAKLLRQWKAMGLGIADLFRPEAAVQRQVVEHAGADRLDVAGERHGLQALYAALAHRAANIDPTLRALVEARAAEALKGLDRIAEGMVRALKRREQTAMERIARVHRHLFPGGEPQERVEAFVHLLAVHGEGVLDEMLATLDPLEPAFTLFEEV